MKILYRNKLGRTVEVSTDVVAIATDDGVIMLSAATMGDHTSILTARNPKGIAKMTNLLDLSTLRTGNGEGNDTR